MDKDCKVIAKVIEDKVIKPVVSEVKVVDQGHLDANARPQDVMKGATFYSRYSVGKQIGTLNPTDYVPILSMSLNGTTLIPDKLKNVEITVDKKTVGLDKVDNTSDEDKPISKAQQDALDDKVDIFQGLDYIGKVLYVNDAGNVDLKELEQKLNTLVGTEEEPIKLYDSIEYGKLYFITGKIYQDENTNISTRNGETYLVYCVSVDNTAEPKVKTIYIVDAEETNGNAQLIETTGLGVTVVVEETNIINSIVNNSNYYAKLFEENTFNAPQVFNEDVSFNKGAEHYGDVRIHNAELVITDDTKDVVARYNSDKITLEENNETTYNLLFPKKNGTLATLDDIVTKIGIKHSELVNIDKTDNGVIEKIDAWRTTDPDSKIFIYNGTETDTTGLIVERNYAGITYDGSFGKTEITVSTENANITATNSNGKIKNLSISPEHAQLDGKDIITSVGGTFENRPNVKTNGETSDVALLSDLINYVPIQSQNGTYYSLVSNEDAQISNRIFKNGDAEDTVSTILNYSGLSIKGNVNITGNITQNGQAYETHAEQIYTKNDEIITRDGAVSGLGIGQLTGLRAKLYDGINDGQLGFDSAGTARVGDIGDTQPLLTRSEKGDLINNHLLSWDSTNLKAVDSGKSLGDLVSRLALGEVNRVYVRTTNSTDTSLPFTYTAEGNSIAYRNASGRLAVETPTEEQDATNKSYVDKLTAKYLPLTGGTITGKTTFTNGADETVRINSTDAGMGIGLGVTGFDTTQNKAVPAINIYKDAETYTTIKFPTDKGGTFALKEDIPSASEVAWGKITGTLSHQTDLQNQLNNKLSTTGGNLTGAIAIKSTDGTLISHLNDDGTDDYGVSYKNNTFEFGNFGKGIKLLGNTARPKYESTTTEDGGVELALLSDVGTVVSVAGKEKTSINTDTTPTANSQNLVTSGGVHDYPAIAFAESERQKSKNLFDYTKAYDFTACSSNNDGSFNINVNNFYYPEFKYKCNVEIGKQYTFSAYINSYTSTVDTVNYSARFIYTDGTGDESNTPAIIGQRVNFTLTPQKEVDYILFRILRTNVEATTTGVVSNIQIEQGSVATDYQPYYGQIARTGDKEIEFAKAEYERSKNLLGVKSINYVSVANDGLISINYTLPVENPDYNFNILKNNIYLKKGHTYTFSIQKYTNISGVGRQLITCRAKKVSDSTEIGDYLFIRSDETTKTITPTEDIYIISCSFYGYYPNESATINFLCYLQIEENSIATDYQPYQGGEFVQEEQLNEKVSTHSMIPSSNKVTNIYDFTTTGYHNYTAPANGYVTIFINLGTASPADLWLQNQTVGLEITFPRVNNTSVYIPCKKGDTVVFYTSEALTSTYNTSKFIYAED